jgi:hypothetical protein
MGIDQEGGSDIGAIAIMRKKESGGAERDEISSQNRLHPNCSGGIWTTRSSLLRDELAADDAGFAIAAPM